MNGIELVTKERHRQVEKENWDADHDDNHTSMCLATASAAYALDVAAKHADVDKSWKDTFKECADKIWPFDNEWFKPTPEDPIRQLVKAGALLVAEIDRLHRAQADISTVNATAILPDVSECVRVLETMHENTHAEFHKYRLANFDGLKVTLTGKEMNEIIRLAKIKTKGEHFL